MAGMGKDRRILTFFFPHFLKFYFKDVRLRVMSNHLRDFCLIKLLKTNNHLRKKNVVFFFFEIKYKLNNMLFSMKMFCIFKIQ